MIGDRRRREYIISEAESSPSANACNSRACGRSRLSFCPPDGANATRASEPSPTCVARNDRERRWAKRERTTTHHKEGGLGPTSGLTHSSQITRGLIFGIAGWSRADLESTCPPGWTWAGLGCAFWLDWRLARDRNRPGALEKEPVHTPRRQPSRAAIPHVGAPLSGAGK